jgi:F0F1-type ATP synthase membrane subunit b/b'
MDQTIVNWLFVAFGATLGWLVTVVWGAIKELRSDMKQIERDLPEVYVRRDDFRNVVADIKVDMKDLRQDMKEGFIKVDSVLTAIYKKLDGEKLN